MFKFGGIMEYKQLGDAEERNWNISHMSQEERDIQHEKIDQLDRIIKRLDYFIFLFGMYILVYVAGVICSNN